jgi:hypothetical protein
MFLNPVEILKLIFLTEANGFELIINSLTNSAVLSEEPSSETNTSISPG